MRRRARHWSVWVHGAIAASVAVAMAVAVAQMRPRAPSDEVRLALALGDLRARTAELAAVAEQGAAGRLTRAFAAAQANALRDKLVDASAEVRDTQGGASREPAGRALALAEDALRASEPLVADPAERDFAAARGALDAAAASLRAVERAVATAAGR